MTWGWGQGEVRTAGVGEGGGWDGARRGEALLGEKGVAWMTLVWSRTVLGPRGCHGAFKALGQLISLVSRKMRACEICPLTPSAAVCEYPGLVYTSLISMP